MNPPEQQLTAISSVELHARINVLLGEMRQISSRFEEMRTEMRTEMRAARERVEGLHAILDRRVVVLEIKAAKNDGVKEAESGSTAQFWIKLALLVASLDAIGWLLQRMMP